MVDYIDCFQMLKQPYMFRTSPSWPRCLFPVILSVTLCMVFVMVSLSITAYKCDLQHSSGINILPLIILGSIFKYDLEISWEKKGPKKKRKRKAQIPALSVVPFPFLMLQYALYHFPSV